MGNPKRRWRKSNNPQRDRADAIYRKYLAGELIERPVPETRERVSLPVRCYQHDDVVASTSVVFEKGTDRLWSVEPVVFDFSLVDELFVTGISIGNLPPKPPTSSDQVYCVGGAILTFPAGYLSIDDWALEISRRLGGGVSEPKMKRLGIRLD